MWHQGILKGGRTTEVQTESGHINRPARQGTAAWFRWLSWREWLVFFGMGAAVILLELRNHRMMWLEHGSGQTVWTDPELVGEIILFGLILPILGGLILGYQARTAVERDQIAEELALRRQLVAQIHKAKSWVDLVDIVVQTPGAVVPAAYAWLLLQRTNEESFMQVAHWHRPGHQLRLPLTNDAMSTCEQCLSSTVQNGTRIVSCDHSGGADQSTRYCLTFCSEITGKAALFFELPAEQQLARRQISMLDDLGKEISLAIDNANLNHLKQRQDSVARGERLRIARNLHDTLGQNISYLRLKLEQLNDTNLAGDPHRFQDDLVNMLAVADEAYLQVRDTLDELRASEQQELETIIGNYATQVSQRAGLLVDTKSSGKPRNLSATTSRQLMYIIREALNNVEKHASATAVQINLMWQPNLVEITISDDGQGFDTTAARQEGHYGLTIMEERARAIHADLVISSRPHEQGTHLKLCLPLPTGSPVMLRDS
ncbi:MAG: hypothetical protein H6651_06800 [Ardenticatenales bacterium]|nr:hypothetical protein [Ardenticatenales bacterium]